MPGRTSPTQALFATLVTRRLRPAAQDAAQRAQARSRTDIELEREGIAPGARGETLSVADYVRLANALTHAGADTVS